MITDVRIGILDSSLRESRCREFLSRTRLTESGCRVYVLSLDSRGYARTSILGISVQIHRFIAFSLLLDNDEDRKQKETEDVCHHCDNPPCIEPSHLFFGTRSENMQDCVRKGRHTGNIKLSDTEIKEIRAIGTTLTIYKIAKIYKVTPQHIWNILNNKRRQSVQNNVP